MPLPTLTPEQNREALTKALAVRQARAAELARLRQGTLTLAAVLDDGDSPLQGAKVRKVLLAVPKIGPATADAILAEIGIHANRKVAGLGSRQREALAERFAA